MLCLFNFPAYIDCNIGYQIPSLHAPASPSLSIEEEGTDSTASSPSSCSVSARFHSVIALVLLRVSQKGLG